MWLLIYNQHYNRLVQFVPAKSLLSQKCRGKVQPQNLVGTTPKMG